MLEKHEVCCGTAGQSATMGSTLGSLRVIPRVSFGLLFTDFSKKLATLANIKAMVAMFFVWYNFCRVHQTLRMPFRVREATFPPEASEPCD